MFPASCKASGQCVATGPDVCKTPSPGGPVPIPYPNIAMVNQADGGSCSSKVKIVGKPAVIKSTEIPMSTGDEAGTAGGGVVSNKFKGNCQFKMGSMKVKVEGKDLCRQTSMTGMNGGSNANVPGQQVAPSQTKVMVS